MNDKSKDTAEKLEGDVPDTSALAVDTSALDLSSLKDMEGNSDSESLDVSSLSADQDSAQGEAAEETDHDESAIDKHARIHEKELEWSAEHGSEALFRDTVAMIESHTISMDNGIRLLKKAASEGCVLSWIYLGKLFSDGNSERYNPALAFDCFSNAARLNSGEGCYYLGLCYANGVGCAIDNERAEEMFSKGGELDHAECFCALGICREQGIGCEIDYPMAVRLYEYGADLGSANAANNLGGCYFYGHGVEQDKARAVEVYKRAAEMGSSNARCRLGICFEEGEGCERDHSMAFALYSVASNDGNAIALYRLALCYDKGIGVEQNFATAFKYYNLSAEAGYAPAMHESGLMSKIGRGTQKSASAAYHMFSLAADAGYSPSEFEVGNCYFEGVGTVRNLENAFLRYENAYNVDNSNAEAAFKLGLCCLKGLGVKKDPARAFEWFSRSAEAGSREAMLMMGECYYFGIGTAESRSDAVSCYESVAATDIGDDTSVKAFVILAHCLEKAIGTSKDPEAALALYKKAADYGDAEAMYCAGRAIMSGIGDASEQSQARGYILRSARSSYTPASLAMGIFADDGRGVARNAADAERWYLRAVNSEIKSVPELYDFPERVQERATVETEARLEAQYRLGMILVRNDPSIQSYMKAFEHIALAASMGHADAQIEISKMYLHGGELKGYYESALFLADGDMVGDVSASDKESIGNAMNKLGDAYYDGKSSVAKNHTSAVRCYKIAAELGQNDACYSYGWCLRHGMGVRENAVEAVKWLKIAADRGNSHAAYSYGLCCEEGAGTGIKNKREARSYYRKAAAAGHAEAQKRYLDLSSTTEIQ